MPLCDTGGAAKGLGHLLYAFATTSNRICCLFMVFLFSVSFFLSFPSYVSDGKDNKKQKVGYGMERCLGDREPAKLVAM